MGTPVQTHAGLFTASPFTVPFRVLSMAAVI